MNSLLLSRSVQFIDDRQKLARLILFNYLVGNCDAHAKNYSVMLGRTGSVMLAPAYDLLSTAVYDGGFGAELSRGMGMRIGAHSNIDRVTAEDLALLAKSLGMSVVRLSQMACELAEVLPRAVDDAAALLQEKTPDETSELAERIHKGIEKRSSICLSL